MQAHSKLHVNETSAQRRQRRSMPRAHRSGGERSRSDRAVESDDPTIGGVGVAGWASSNAGNGVGVWGETGGSWARGSGHRNPWLRTELRYQSLHQSPNGYAGYFLGGRNYFQGNVGIGWDKPVSSPLFVTSSALPGLRGCHHGPPRQFHGTGVWRRLGADQHLGWHVSWLWSQGVAGANHGTGRGVLAEAYADSGVAVYAIADHHTGVNCGIEAHSNSPNGYAGYFGGGRNYFSGNVGLGLRTP